MASFQRPALSFLLSHTDRSHFLARSGAPAPDPVEDLSVEAGEELNTITWTEVEGLTYRLYHSTSPDVTTTSGTLISGVTSPYEHAELEIGVEVYYVVVAVGPGGASAVSNEDSGIPLDPDNGFDDLFADADDTAMKARWHSYNGNTAGGANLDVTQVGGRYFADVAVHSEANSDNRLLWYLTQQGAGHFQLMDFPFEVHAYNIGIGLPGDTQTVPEPGVDTEADPWMFCGLCVHRADEGGTPEGGFDDTIFELTTAAHRGSFAHYTIELKESLVGGDQSIYDLENDDAASDATGTVANAAPLGRVDLRVVGTAGGATEWYYRQPGAETWLRIRQAGFRVPTYSGGRAWVGIVTYTFGAGSLNFVGTCDGFVRIS